MRHVIERELKDVLQSTKFAWAFGTCSFLIVMAFVIGARVHRDHVKRHEAAVAENLRQMEGQKDWLSVQSHRIFLPPRPLEALVTGVSADIGRTIPMRGRGELSAVDSRYGEDPLLALFRFLDLEFTFQVVLPLFAIVLAFDAINGEKERGTLRLIFANAVPRARYVLGKIVGAFLGLALPLLVPILLGCLLLGPLGVSLTGEEWTRLGLVTAAGLGYFGVFLCLSVLVSALTRRSSSSFLLLLVAWILAALVLPRTSVLLGGRAVDVLSVDEIAHQMGQLRLQLFQEHLGGLGEFKPSSGSDPESMMAEFNTFMQERADAREKKLKELRDRLNEERRNGQARQESVAFSLARLSPAAAFSLAAGRLAGTSIELKRHFLEEALRYQDPYGKFMLEKTGMNLGGHVMVMKMASDDDAEEEPIDPHELPAFRPRSRSLAEDLEASAVDLGVLVLDAVLLVGGAVLAFVRYDVR